MTSPDVMVYLEDVGEVVSSDGNGYFQFSGVELSPGENLFTVIAVDAGGNYSYTQRTIICVATSDPTPP